MSSSNPFIGEIIMFGGNFAPRGWAFCNGQLLPISQNTALFSILGTTYGGDGRTTFGLPDLRGRVPMHPGTAAGLSTYRLGAKTGAEKTTLTTNQIPSHTHGIEPACDDRLSTAGSPKGMFPAADKAGGPVTYSASGPDKMAKFDSDATGGGQPVDIRQPSQCVNFIIALQGVYPSRS